jgi:hypothetical protein
MAQNKPQQIHENGNNPMHSISPQCIKIRIQQQKQQKKHANNWKLNNTLLSDQFVIDEIKEEIKRFLEVNKNENTTYLYLWDTAKAVLSGKFIAMSAYIKGSEKSQINGLIL